MSEALRNSGPVVRLAMVGVATMLLGGCADSSRVGDPFSDPFRTSSSRYDHSPTGSVTQAQPQSQGNFFSEAFRPFDDHPSNDRPTAGPTRAPDYERPHYAPPMAVQSQPLQPPRAVASRPYAPRSVEPTFRPAPAPAPSASIMRSGSGGSGGWSAEGGVPVVVAQGETAAMIATRYGVPTATLLSLNGYNSGVQVQPGSRLVIPTITPAARNMPKAGRGTSAGRRPRRGPVQPRHMQAARLEAPRPATASPGSPAAGPRGTHCAPGRSRGGPERKARQAGAVQG